MPEGAESYLVVALMRQFSTWVLERPRSVQRPGADRLCAARGRGTAGRSDCRLLPVADPAPCQTPTTDPSSQQTTPLYDALQPVLSHLGTFAIEHVSILPSET